MKPGFHSPRCPRARMIRTRASGPPTKRFPGGRRRGSTSKCQPLKDRPRKCPYKLTSGRAAVTGHFKGCADPALARVASSLAPRPRLNAIPPFAQESQTAIAEAPQEAHPGNETRSLAGNPSSSWQMLHAGDMGLVACQAQRMMTFDKGSAYCGYRGTQYANKAKCS